MVQEFRYLASGALIAVSLVLALAINDTTGLLAGWQLAALALALAAPLGWIQYQWHGFLMYRRGGLEAYRETQALKAALDDCGDAMIDWVASCGSIPAPQLRQRLAELGDEYYTRLEADIGLVCPRPTNGAYALLHNLVFAGQPAHAFGGGRYGVHNMLAAFMWSIYWSLALVLGGAQCRTVASLARPTNEGTALLAAVGGTAIVMLLARTGQRWASTPGPALVPDTGPRSGWLVASAPAATSLLLPLGSAKWPMANLALGALVVFGFLVAMARRTSAMLLLEAELYEDLMTWTRTYQTRSRAPSASSQVSP
jgi:hypothetical protein